MSCNCSTLRSNIASAEFDNSIWRREIKEFQEKIKDCEDIISDFESHDEKVTEFKDKADQAKSASHARFVGNNHKTKYQSPLESLIGKLSAVNGAIGSNISALQQKIAEYQQEIATREANIQANESWIAGMEASIAACDEC